MSTERPEATPHHDGLWQGGRQADQRGSDVWGRGEGGGEEEEDPGEEHEGSEAETCPSRDRES